MTNKEYEKLAMRTDTMNYNSVEKRRAAFSMSTEHGIIGLVTEAGELMDAYKKHVMYGQKFDRVNLIEECGDCLWYMVVMLRSIGASLDDAMKANVAKLRKRYPQGYCDEDAVNRDVDAEQQVLAFETKFLKG